MTTDELKSAIQAAVYENSTGAITGTALQGILLNVVDSLATPVINVTGKTGPIEVTGTPAELAEALGVSENVVNRMINREIPEVIFKNNGACYLAPMQSLYTYLAHYEFGSTGFYIVNHTATTFNLSVYWV